MSKSSATLVFIGAAAGAIAAAAGARHIALTWGSRPDERADVLPGDDLVTGCQVQADRAIDIGAPAAVVWPWLVQIGQDRAGFYSYEALENMVGCDIVGVLELRPEWSAREVGEAVNLAPGMALDVVVAEPPSALVLAAGQIARPGGSLFPDTDEAGRGSDAPVDGKPGPSSPGEVGNDRENPELGDDEGEQRAGDAEPTSGTAGQGGDVPGMPQAFSWAFIVTDKGDGTSRLHVRERYRFDERGALARVGVPFASAIMTQKMLRTIRDLAEASR